MQVALNRWNGQIRRTVLKNRGLHNSSIHAFIPAARKGGEAVEELIREIAQRVILSLDEMEEATDFDTLTNLTDPQLREEALLLQEEISKLRSCLQNI
ncbi:MAG TPA: hypothetical protein DER33_01080 [Syntrophomonas sp.]|jgi:hypothetical protein|nr:hypothetical protein [Syntrophomonas sp.]HCF70181.1 hypothetical protein [Syntrophomonas sp.]